MRKTDKYFIIHVIILTRDFGLGLKRKDSFVSVSVEIPGSNNIVCHPGDEHRTWGQGKLDCLLI